MKKILLSLLLVFTISMISCSIDEQKQTNKNNSTVFAKEGDSLKDGDTLQESTIDFKAAEFAKEKHLQDTTIVGVEYESEYGRSTIVCRKPNKTLSTLAGPDYGQASGCLYSNGVLYSFTWTAGHWDEDGERIFWVPAHSTYTVNSNCSCP